MRSLVCALALAGLAVARAAPPTAFAVRDFFAGNFSVFESRTLADGTVVPFEPGYLNLTFLEGDAEAPLVGLLVLGDGEDRREVQLVQGSSNSTGRWSEGILGAAPLLRFDLNFVQVSPSVFAASGSTAVEGKAFRVLVSLPDFFQIEETDGHGASSYLTASRMHVRAEKSWLQRYGPVLLIAALFFVQIFVKSYFGGGLTPSAVAERAKQGVQEELQRSASTKESKKSK